MRSRVPFFLAALGAAAFAMAIDLGATIATPISEAVADSHRPPEQRKLDDARKPAEVIAFAGVKPGDRVADFMPGNAYFTRILSKVVGPAGHVYAFTPMEQITNCDPAETAGSHAIEHDPVYRNVIELSGPVNEFSVSQTLDMIWIAQNYHDLHDTFLGPADVKRVNRSFFKALKPGGYLIIIDHAGASGSGLRDTEKLHRIEPLSVRAELEAAGFVFESETSVLRNENDDHSRSVFDPVIRGKTDQFVFKFMKPGISR